MVENRLPAKGLGGSPQDLKSYYRCGTLVTQKALRWLPCRLAGRILPASVCPPSEAVQRTAAELLLLVNKQGNEQTRRAIKGSWRMRPDVL